ncbi:YbaK/EbsC family protein [Lactobacillus sp. ESL0791]|uniref:YbaK/EbsC family protein n=1 Tax=Lactobacillus sp. ESL0791 TaxID=2983234 RepID=UPI0023F8C906|nr:YbaK/EbsC family protein [Lactobacillus sp. ESL0791]MDF7638718.1 YbaK/EbsC family protein [Lactobacillus sp. ESL0791]
MLFFYAGMTPAVKLTNHLGDGLRPATEDEAVTLFGAHFGSLGKIGLKEGTYVIADRF